LFDYLLVKLHLFFIVFIGDLFFPFSSFAVHPDSFLDLDTSRAWLRHYVKARAMLFSLTPFTVIGSAICPEIDTSSALSVIDVRAHENSSISPLVNTMAMHHVVFPVTQVQAIIMPDEQASSVEHVLRPFTNVSVAVWPAVFSLTFF